MTGRLQHKNRYFGSQDDSCIMGCFLQYCYIFNRSKSRNQGINLRGVKLRLKRGVLAVSEVPLGLKLEERAVFWRIRVAAVPERGNRGPFGDQKGI